MCVSISIICESRLEDFLFIYYFGMNVLLWCPFVLLFGTPFQNLPYGHEPKEAGNAVSYNRDDWFNYTPFTIPVIFLL